LGRPQARSGLLESQYGKTHILSKQEFFQLRHQWYLKCAFANGLTAASEMIGRRKKSMMFEFCYFNVNSKN
jgi:hypothetical protein